MYSLDVNFLNDRPEYRPIEQKRSAPRPVGEKTPLIAGLAVGLLLPALVGGLLLFLQTRIAYLQEQEKGYDAELARLKIGQQKLDQLNKQITEVNAETTALATVFNQIKPWSAMLQDIRERTPPNLRIKTIQQKAVAPPRTASNTPQQGANKNAKNAKDAPVAASAPRPATQLEISGTARSFDDINNFLLTLQRSPFFESDKTQLIKAELVNNPDRVEQTSREARVNYELPKVVQYTIQTNLSDVSASELLRELDRKGAVGLVTRIRKLQEIQQTGVKQQ